MEFRFFFLSNAAGISFGWSVTNFQKRQGSLPPAACDGLVTTSGREREPSLLSKVVFIEMCAQVEMNDPHKPGRPDEVERVTRANGWVTTEK